MNRILTIQDISCVGKCSLTVALPIISACGVETAILPTAVLSNHTMFPSWTFKDLTDDLDEITNKWKELNIDFNAIYTGYLGSFRQLDIVSKIFDDFKKKNTTILIDPVMADNGKLYKGFSEDFPTHMAKLCAKADIIVPNMTEASFMLNIPYVESGYTEDYIKDLLVKLTKLGSKIAVLTGISFEKDKLGIYSYNSETKEYFSYFSQKLPVSFHGTGDIYASTLLGALEKGLSLNESLKVAVDYTVQCIKITMENKKHNFYGVDFETAIPYLVERLK